MHSHADKNRDETGNAAGHAKPPRREPVSRPATAVQCRFPGNATQKTTAHIALRCNATGMPNTLKSGLEQLSGLDLSPVRVHYNSPKPAQVGALAYAQGTNIHLGPGQERHLQHEGWHVVQQMQNRVRPTIQYKNTAINDDTGLEREADVMGHRAAATGLGDTRPLLRHCTAPVSMAPIQRVPIDLDDDTWLEEWYAKDPRHKSRTTQQKYMQMLNTLMEVPDTDEPFVERVRQIDWPSLANNLQLLASMITFHMHVAPYVPIDRQGRDRNRRDNRRGSYFRSNEHRYRDIYRQILQVLEFVKMANSTQLPPLNLPLVKRLKETGSPSESIHSLNMSRDGIVITSTAIRDNFASLAIVHNNYTLMQRALELIRESRTLLRQNAIPVIFDEPKLQGPTYSGTGRTIDGIDDTILGPTLDEILRLLDKRVAPASDRNFHDRLLEDRAALVSQTANTINSSGGSYQALNTEGHPNLIIHSKKHDRGKEWQQYFTDIMNDRDTTGAWKTLSTIRGSFAHQRPSVAEVDHSLRFSPGFAPAEIVRADVARTLRIMDSPTEDYDFSSARIHVEALKTAVRHAQIAIRRGHALKVKRTPVLPWLQTRLIINLTKAMFLLDKYENREGDSDFNLGQHYIKTVDVLENLQEYTIIYTAHTLEAQKATQTEDPYEYYLKSSDFIDGPDSYRIFYLDSGMQAINTSTVLVRDFKKSKAMLGKNINAYYEFSGVSTSQNVYSSAGSAKRYAEEPTTEDNIVVTDLSPVITDPEKLDLQNSTKQEHFTNIREKVGEDDIPVLDITNSTLGDVSRLIGGNRSKSWAKNYILVDSLIKLHQLGSDKFTQGRMIVVGSSEFLRMATEVVGPIANEAANPLASAVRKNLDQAIYGGSVVELSDQWSRNFVETAAKYDPFMEIMELAQAWGTAKGGSAMVGEDSAEPAVDPAAGWRVLNIAFDEYVNYATSGGGPDPKYEAAFKALPSSDQHELMRRVMQIIAPGNSKDVPQWVANNVQQTGITNVGNSCYLAAGLTMLAFSPYATVFPHPAPLPPFAPPVTQKEQLRGMIGQILYRIQQGRAVGTDRIDSLLTLLDRLGLLPQPSATALARGARATRSQHDPNEVFFRKLLDFFSEEMGSMHLVRTYQTQIIAPDIDPVVLDANPASYSALGPHNILQEPQRLDTVLELATTGAADLRQAMRRYLAEEQIPDVKYVDDDNLVRRGTARRRILLGAQTPTVITLALVRWAGVAKDTRSIDMPDYFVLNGVVYRLDTVIYHHGATPDSGHYTASNRVPGTDNWQHRDDSSVGDDPHFAARKGRGYLFTYTASGEEGPEHASLLHLDNPGPVDDVEAPSPETEISQKRNASQSGGDQRHIKKPKLEERNAESSHKRSVRQSGTDQLSIKKLRPEGWDDPHQN